MISFALSLALIAQAAPDLYAVVAPPFQPPSNFGRERAQGDAEIGVYRRPLAKAVTVDDYRRSYEASPSDLEAAYDQGVAQAEINADRRMGSLDGRWRVVDAEGRTLMSLLLSDRGDDRPVEGAWRKGARLGPVAGVERSGVQASVPVEGGVLRLERGLEGWRGQWVGDGGARPVELRPAA